MPSFDILSEVDQPALRNALEHAVTREAATRPIGPAVIR